MKRIKEKIKSRLRKENVLIYLAPVSVVAIAIFLSDLYGFDIKNTLSTFNLVVVGLFLSFLIFIASAAVMKAILHISAGLTFVIFIAQSYCGTLTRTLDGDNALRVLILVSVIYILFDFGSILYKEVKKYLSDIPEKGSITHFVIAVLILLFILSLLSMIIQVIVPVLLDLCIF